MITEVADAIVANRLVLFIGAGFAMNIKLPSWKKLIEALLESYPPQDVDKKMEIDNLISLGYLSNAVDKIAEYSNTPLGTIKETVANLLKSLSSSEEDNFDQSYYYLSELYKCGATKIVTTNYDNSIEDKLHILGRNVLYPNSKLQNINDIRTEILKDRYYLKLHGGINDYESLVLFEKDYRDRYILDDQIPNLLQELFTHNRILFIGCGLTDRYMDIFEKLKLRDAVMNSYVICRANELKWIAAKNSITRITIDNYDKLPELLEKIFEKTRRKRQIVSKHILFSDIPLETYDYSSAKQFFDEVKRNNVNGCYFFNTQVEFSSWFSPSLQLHLSQQMEACGMRKNFDHFRIVFLPYNKLNFFNRIEKNKSFYHDIKAMVKIHLSMHCKLAFITSDVLLNIFNQSKEFFITNCEALGLVGLDKISFSNIEDILKNQIQNGYSRKNDLDFSVIKPNNSKIVKPIQIWQANYEVDANLFTYSKMTDKIDIYIRFYEIIIKYVKENNDSVNPKIRQKSLYSILGLNN